MDLLARFKINSPKVVHDTMDNEVVIVEFDSGNYYSLDKAGADIWNLINSGASVNEIIEAIAHRYKDDRAVIENAVNQLLTELQQEDLIVPDQTKEPRSIHEPEVCVGSGSEVERSGFEAPILHKYTDMQDLLLLDPIHGVDETGWPSVKPDSPNEDE